MSPLTIKLFLKIEVIMAYLPELGKVTLKSNSDEALSDESPLKSNGDEAFNDDFPLKVTAMKRLVLSKKT
jgi:hypothetical protein